jgi:hypothetical protein
MFVYAILYQGLHFKGQNFENGLNRNVLFWVYRVVTVKWVAGQPVLDCPQEQEVSFRHLSVWTGAGADSVSSRELYLGGKETEAWSWPSSRDEITNA